MTKVRRMKVFSDKEFARLLKANGYVFDRQKGDHIIYTNNDNGKHITVKYPINPCISRRLIKEFNLK